MSEKPRGGATPAPRPHIALARELIADAKPIDEPTVEVSGGFNVSTVIQLPAPTPEDVEAMRRKAAGPPSDNRRTGMSTPRSGDTPQNSGGKRERGWLE
jgi:hypothetical protein